jgi:hypothetical protein
MFAIFLPTEILRKSEDLKKQTCMEMDPEFGIARGPAI